MTKEQIMHVEEISGNLVEFKQNEDEKEFVIKEWNYFLKKFWSFYLKEKFSQYIKITEGEFITIKKATKEEFQDYETE